MNIHAQNGLNQAIQVMAVIVPYMVVTEYFGRLSGMIAGVASLIIVLLAILIVLLKNDWCLSKRLVLDTSSVYVYGLIGIGLIQVLESGAGIGIASVILAAFTLDELMKISGLRELRFRGSIHDIKRQRWSWSAADYISVATAYGALWYEVSTIGILLLSVAVGSLFIPYTIEKAYQEWESLMETLSF